MNLSVHGRVVWSFWNTEIILLLFVGYFCLFFDSTKACQSGQIGSVVKVTLTKQPILHFSLKYVWWSTGCGHLADGVIVERSRIFNMEDMEKCSNTATPDQGVRNSFFIGAAWLVFLYTVIYISEAVALNYTRRLLEKNLLRFFFRRGI